MTDKEKYFWVGFYAKKLKSICLLIRVRTVAHIRSFSGIRNPDFLTVGIDVGQRFAGRVQTGSVEQGLLLDSQFIGPLPMAFLRCEIPADITRIGPFGVFVENRSTFVVGFPGERAVGGGFGYPKRSGWASKLRKGSQ